MYEKFVSDNWIFLLENIFKDYLWTQFFPSKFLCKDTYNYSKIKDIYIKIFKENQNINNLYIHIPFCKTKCFYCHCFTHVWENFINDYDNYIDYLIKELQIIIWFSNDKIKLNSIFIWGGTPNIVWYKNLDKLYNFISKNFDLSNLKQNNIDLNPYCLDIETIEVLKKYKINRCTYAIQSFDNKVLQKNSRFNTEINHKTFVKYLQDSNVFVNIDLMIWIKWQTFEICKNDIKSSIDLNADNISLNYFIQSENVSYKINNDWKNIIFKVKKYFNKIINNKYNRSNNFQEETYLKQKVNLIWVGNGAITHINSFLMWYNNFSLKEYYKNIDNNIIYSDLKFLDKKFELIKYLFFNLVFDVNLDFVNKNFWGFDELNSEMDFLFKNKILEINNNILSSKVNNFKLYLYLTIFLKDYLNNVVIDNKNQIEKIFSLKQFFLDNWEKIDEDY